MVQLPVVHVSILSTSTYLAVNFVRYIPQYYRVRTVYVEAFIRFISDTLVGTTRVYLGNDLTKSYF